MVNNQNFYPRSKVMSVCHAVSMFTVVLSIISLLISASFILEIPEMYTYNDNDIYTCPFSIETSYDAAHLNQY
jgi:hypothetical protein